MSYLILACAGMDKPEGSVAREVALRLAEEGGAEIVCPVALNRTPARYQKALAEKRLVVVDGCATRCAGRLAAAAGAKPVQKILVSEVAKQEGVVLPSDLRLGAEALALVRKIVGDVAARQSMAVGAPNAEAPLTAVSQPEPQDASPSEAAGPASPGEPVGFAPPGDLLVVVYDKFEFRVPAKGFLFNANDVWAQVAGGRARVGISDYMQQRLTDITYVDLPQVGAMVEQFDDLCVVESTKATFGVVSPVNGRVIAVNEALEDVPESINEDPYGSWIAELELTAWEEDRAWLVDGPAYAAEVERKASEDSRP